jgi:hypothetical protein
LDDELDPDLSEETFSGSESPPASTVPNTSQASRPTTDERSQNTINSGVSDDEFGAITLDTDTVGNEQGEPEPVLTRKPVRLPSACTHCRF